MQQESTSATRHEDGAYRWWVLVTVVFAAFASILDSTIVNTALPRIQTLFGAGIHEASYVATAYILAAGVVVPATGYLANRFGIKRVYLISLTLFTFGSALCGAAPTMGLLIAFRVLQGMGGAALFPLSFALLFSVFPPEERGKANGIFGIPVLAAPALGPTLGGYLTQYVDWRWVFYVNLPVGVVGVLLGARILRETPARPDLRFDLPGFLLAASGLGLLLFGLSNLAYDGWSNVVTVSGPILLSLALLVAFVVAALRAEQPLLNLRLFAQRNYGLGTALVLLGVIGLFGPGFLLPQFLQGLRGQTPFEAGLLLLWGGVGAVIGSILSGQLYNRLGPKLLILIGGVDLIVTSFLLALWCTATSSLNLLALILLTRGVGLPLVMQSTNTVALEGIRGPALPGATTLGVVTRNVMGSLSIALLTNYLQDRSTTHLAAAGIHGAGGATKSVFGAQHIPPPVLDALAAGFQDTFVVCTVVVIPVLLLGALLRPSFGRGGRQASAADPPQAPPSRAAAG